MTKPWIGSAATSNVIWHPCTSLSHKGLWDIEETPSSELHSLTEGGVYAVADTSINSCLTLRPPNAEWLQQSIGITFTPGRMMECRVLKVDADNAGHRAMHKSMDPQTLLSTPLCRVCVLPCLSLCFPLRFCAQLSSTALTINHLFP